MERLASAATWWHDGPAREALTRVLGPRPRVRILLEAGTESEWVTACLEGLGHEVIFADPNARLPNVSQTLPGRPGTAAA